MYPHLPVLHNTKVSILLAHMQPEWPIFVNKGIKPYGEGWKRHTIETLPGEENSHESTCLVLCPKIINWQYVQVAHKTIDPYLVQTIKF